MTTAIAPPGPPPVEGAQWNGEQWFRLNATGTAWEPVGTTPALPPPSGNVAASGTPPAVETDDEERGEIEEGTLEDYNNQPASSGGAGPTWKFKDRPIGTTYRGIVADDLPIRITREKSNDPKRQRPWQMWVPMLVMPDDDFPDGRSQCVFSGDKRDKLNAAMQVVGAPTVVDAQGKEGYVPQPGAFIQVTHTASQKVRNRDGKSGDKFLYEVHYRVPGDPNIQEIKQQILDAIASVEDAPPPPKMRFNAATKQWEVDTTAAPEAPVVVTAPALPPPGAVPAASTAPAVATSNGAAPSTPAVPPAAGTPAPAAPTTPELPPASTATAATSGAPAVPPASTGPTTATGPGHTAEALQAAAGQVATSDATPPAAAGNGASATPRVNITDEQWLQIAPAARKVVADRAGVSLPERYDPASPSYMGV
jgi:hypothetical protein